MKLFLRILCLLLSILLIGLPLVACSPSDDPEDNSDPTGDASEGDATNETKGLKYELNKSKTAYTVVGYMGTSGTVTVPSKYQGLPVTAIGDSAFKENARLGIITLPETIVSIGSQAFYCCRLLQSVTLADGLAEIGDSAFAGCARLTEIALPSTLMSIGDFAFESTGLKSIYIPENVNDIGRGAFCNCEQLSTIQVEPSNTFYHAEENSLIETEERLLIAVSTDCIIPTGGSVTAIGDNVFAYRNRLTEIVIPDEITKIGNNAFLSCEKLTSIVIPDSVTEIGQGAFAFCHSLQHVEIPEGVTVIGEDTFEACKFLTEIVLPGGLAEIGEGAFKHCVSLLKIVFLGTEEQWEQISFGGAWDEEAGEYSVEYRENP